MTILRASLPRVLLVDDEPHVLDALRRQLRREFSVETAVGAANGLMVLGRAGPFAVVVSDFMMPGIDGAVFLATARKAAPDTARMLLTGHANLEGAAATVNQGQVHRLVLKPADTQTLSAALHDCVAHHNHVVAERELLEQTLQGSVRALSDVLALTNPTGFARASRVRRMVAAVLDNLGEDERWSIELAAMLVQLGAVSLPPEVLAKLDAGDGLEANERAMVDAMPVVAEQLLSSIPRLAPVCAAIRYSRKCYDGSGMPHDIVRGDTIPLGGRLLRLIQDYDELLASGVPGPEVLAALRARTGWYDPELLDALVSTLEADAGEVLALPLAALSPGMILVADVLSDTDVLLVTAGEEVTMSMLSRLRNFSAMEHGVTEPIMARVPGHG